ncbi:hypothetical protein SFA35_18820 [Pseudomonas sp. HR96]|uniref:hypothetical protein n=1 Tax=Pseudomonas sp. HR96 TaxID=1027966 RepID=UPI002A766AF0|nr:hypothetical protein [Pseudomonas sp. HR96]WPO98672.1 hypothetical protein SFA35_18820 [Pseudomonas sp. HR96]
MAARSSTYRIDDEPRPSAWARLAVSPLWPLLGLMLGGTWLGLPWFAFNSVAVGSPTRTRELTLVAVGIAGSVVIGLMLVHAVNVGYIRSAASWQYALLLVLIWKLAIGYALFVQQSATIELYQYYGGVLNRFGIVVVLLATFVLRDPIISAIPHTLWLLVVS